MPHPKIERKNTRKTPLPVLNTLTPSLIDRLQVSRIYPSSQFAFIDLLASGLIINQIRPFSCMYTLQFIDQVIVMTSTKMWISISLRVSNRCRYMWILDLLFFRQKSVPLYSSRSRYKIGQQNYILFQFTHFLVPTLQAESVHTELNFAFYEFLLLSNSTNITKI